MNEKEKSKEKSYEVWHMITPHKYFEEQVQDKPIFGIKNFYGHEFKPIKMAYSGRNVFYMLDEVRTNPRALNMKNIIKRDEWEYFHHAQLATISQLADTFEYRAKNDIGDILTMRFMLSISYIILHYNNFNMIIDFNELNRISLLPKEEAEKELYPLFALAVQCQNWGLLLKSKDHKDKAPLMRERIFECAAFKNPPRLKSNTAAQCHIKQEYYSVELCKSYRFTPWAPQEIENINFEDIEKEFNAWKYNQDEIKSIFPDILFNKN